MAARWVFYYNVSRPHMGGGMAGHPPLGVLQSHGFSGAERIALFPLLLLDPIADALLLACDPEGGNNLLAHYKLWFHRGSNYDHQVVAASGRSVSCEGTRVRKKKSSSPRMRAAHTMRVEYRRPHGVERGGFIPRCANVSGVSRPRGSPPSEAWRGCGPPCPRVRVRSPEANFGRPLARAL
jgi:hypothetical protein